jgi:hypothetical protein
MCLTPTPRQRGPVPVKTALHQVGHVGRLDIGEHLDFVGVLV